LVHRETSPFGSLAAEGSIRSSRKSLKSSRGTAAVFAMYLRFVTPLIHPASRVEAGFFQTSWYLQENGCPDWILAELARESDWFRLHLPVPPWFSRHFKRRNAIHGICWFDPDAREAISHARYCAWLIEEGGLPVRTISTRRQREIIWRDGHQIVAKPMADLPRAFG
jgi:hypothetical protein